MRLGLSKVEVDPESLLDWLATEAAGHNSIAQYGWRPIGILRRFCDAISARTCRRRSHNSGMSAIEFKALNIGVRIIQSLPELPLRGLLALICSLDSLAFKAVQVCIPRSFFCLTLSDSSTGRVHRDITSRQHPWDHCEAECTGGDC